MTAVINGRYMVGAAPAETFEALIDEELAKANPRIQAGTPKPACCKTWVLGKGLTQVESLVAAPAPAGNGSQNGRRRGPGCRTIRP